MKEHEIKRDIKTYLETAGWYVRTIQVKGIRGRKSQSTGISDLIAIRRGIFLAVEVKTKTGKISPEQEEFLSSIVKHGGIAMIARSVDDVREWLSHEH